VATSAIHGALNPTKAGFVPFVLGFFLSARIAITLVAFQSKPGAGTATSIGVSLFFVFLAWIVSSDSRRAPSTERPIVWICAYLVMLGASLFWSVTESVIVAFAYWLGLVSDCLAVYLLMISKSASGLCDQVLTGFVGGAALVGLIAWCLPTLSDLRIGDEDFLHPNALGYTLAIATIVGMHLARRSPIVGILSIFCGVTLLRTISKACIAGCLVAVAFYLLRASHLSRKIKAGIYAITAISIVLGWSLVEAYIDIYDRSSHIETLTGRTLIWSIAWEEALKTPWLGHGFYSFRFIIPVLGDFFPWQAHNELLQQFFSYGAIGLGMFVLLYSSFCRFLHQHRQSEWVAVAAALMVFVIVRGVADAERFDVNFPLWLMTLLTLVISKQRLPSP